MHVVVETPAYLQAAKEAGIDAETLESIVSMVAENPMIGTALRGTGGCRKFRVARPGGGKSGGNRIIHFFSAPHIPVFLLTAFGKNDKANICASETAMLSATTRLIVAAYSKVSKKEKPK